MATVVVLVVLLVVFLFGLCVLAGIFGKSEDTI